MFIILCYSEKSLIERTISILFINKFHSVTQDRGNFSYMKPHDKPTMHQVCRVYCKIVVISLLWHSDVWGNTLDNWHSGTKLIFCKTCIRTHVGLSTRHPSCQDQCDTEKCSLYNHNVSSDDEDNLRTRKIPDADIRLMLEPPWRLNLSSTAHLYQNPSTTGSSCVACADLGS